MHKVAKKFSTTQRRFKADAPVTPADIEGPMGFDDYVAKGFIVEDVPAAVVEPVKSKKVSAS